MTIIADSINSASAAIAIAAAQAKAMEIGVAANIAVIDAGTHLKGFMRMDGAVLGAIEVAIGKARTSALFGISSAVVWTYCQPGAPAPNLQASNGGLMPFPGGLPLTAHSTLIGAVGVSGVHHCKISKSPKPQSPRSLTDRPYDQPTARRKSL